ncbi:MAG: hypothetical protein SFY81_08385 [Verrucomicrobiota bacterium]|nr:hypothetical protein [Verrucomicrobiota bacterium]
MPTIIYHAIAQVLPGGATQGECSFRIFTVSGDATGNEPELPNVHAWQLFTSESQWWSEPDPADPNATGPTLVADAETRPGPAINTHLGRKFSEIAQGLPFKATPQPGMVEEMEVTDASTGPIDTDKSWSSILAGISDHGFPIVQLLGLGCRAGVRPPAVFKAFVLPKLTQSIGWEYINSPAPRIFRFRPEVAPGNTSSFTIILEVELQDLPNETPFLPISGVAATEEEMLSRGGGDWRGELPHTAGRAFDLLRLLASANPQESFKGDAAYTALLALVKRLGWLRVNLGLTGAALAEPGNSPESPFPLMAAQILFGPFCEDQAEQNAVSRLPSLLAAANVTIPGEAKWLECFTRVLKRTVNLQYATVSDFLQGQGAFSTRTADKPGKGELTEALSAIQAALSDDSVLVEIWFELWYETRVPNIENFQPVHRLLEYKTSRDAPLPDATRQHLQDALAASGRGLSARFDDALAGSYWPTIVQALLNGERAAATNPEAPRGLQLRALALASGAAKSFLDLPLSLPAVGGLQPWLADPQAGEAQFVAALRAWIEAGHPAAPPLPAEAEPPPPIPTTEVPLPLQIALADIEMPGAGGGRYNLRGVLIFCRRYPIGQLSKWKAINLGRVFTQLDGQPVTLAGLAAIPVGGTVAHDIPGRVVAYVGSPLGVDLLENEDLDVAVLPARGSLPAPQPVEIHREQLAKRGYFSGWIDEWDSEPGLGYGWTYSFVQSPIYRDGSLHYELLRAEPFTAQDGIPLKSVDAVTALIDEHRAQNESIIQSRNCSRTVGIGELRLFQKWVLAGSAEAEAAGIVGVSGRFIPFFEIPKNDPNPNLIPLSSDVARQGYADQMFDKLDVLILHEGIERFEFFVRPPATSFLDWKSWTRRKLPNDDEWHDHEAEISLARTIIRVLDDPQGYLMDDDEVDLSRVASEPDLLDDRAAIRFLVRVELLYSAEDGFIQKEVSAIHEFDQTINGIAGLESSRRFCSRPIVIERNHRAAPVDLNKLNLGRFDGSTLEIGPGEVWRISTTPLVKRSDIEYFSNSVRGLFVDFDDEYSSVPGSTFSFLAEAAHPSKAEALRLGSAETTDLTRRALEILPSKEQIFDSLLLLSSAEGGWRVKIAVDPTLNSRPDRGWAFVGRVEANLQSWRWNGIPPWSPHILLDGPAPNPQMPAAKPTKHPGLRLFMDKPGTNFKAPATPEEKEYVAAEKRIFATREPESGNAHAKPLGWLPGRVAAPKVKNAEIILNEDKGNDVKFPNFHRCQLVVRSRYHSLPGYADFERLGANSVDAEPWRRLATLAAGPDPLRAPLVKMVIPLFNSIGSNRPGFLVLTGDTLPSPFHTLTATIEVARVKRLTTGETIWAAEAGPDPILDTGAEPAASNSDGSCVISRSNRADDQLPSWATELLDADPLLGRAVGLTFEREALDPMYANSVFLFDSLPPSLDSRRDSDWFLKLTFRWETSVSDAAPIAPTGEWNGKWAQVDKDAGPQSGQWQVRILAPFDKLPFDDAGTPVAISDITFVEDAASKHVKFFAKVSGDQVKEISVYSRSNPCHLALLFISFTSAPDFLSDRPSHVPRSLYLLAKDGPKLVHRFNSPAVAPKSQPMQGVFLRVLVTSPTPPPPGSPQASATDRLMAGVMNLDQLMARFFPGAEKSFSSRLGRDQSGNPAPSSDAQAMVIRASAPISGAA